MTAAMAPTGEADPETIIDLVNPALLQSLLVHQPVLFIDLIVGGLRRVIQRDKEKPYGLSRETVLDVLEALLSHCRSHSNRVWPAVSRLAKITGHGKTAVTSAISYLKKLMITTVIRGDERTLGPGPHEFPVEKRRNEKRMETPCYDLTAALTLLPLQVRKLIAAILGRTAELDAAVDPAQVPVEEVLPRARPVPEQETDPRFFDPFTDAVSDLKEATPPHPSLLIDKNTQHGVAAQRKSLPNPCNVSLINKTDGNQTGAPAEEAPPPRVSSRISGDIYKDRKPVSTPPKPANIPTDPASERAVEALRVLDKVHPMNPVIAWRIIESKGARYAETLAYYGRWRLLPHVGDEHGERIEVISGYLYRTWQGHKDTPVRQITWPDLFLDWLKTERRIASDAERLHTEARQTKEARQERVDAPRSEPGALPDHLRPELLDAALKELLAETKSPPLKDLLRKRGISAAPVEIRAREIFARMRSEGPGITGDR